MKSTIQPIDISIIVTCHAEGILLHKTLASIDRATAHLDQHAVRYEIIVHADRPTESMLEYLNSPQFKKRGIDALVSDFGDLGLSRNYSVTKSIGKYITFIDADDLMSQNWLLMAYKTLQKREYGKYIAHTEMTIEFGDRHSIIQKYGEIDKATDTLLNVYSARWNSVIFAPRVALERIKYPTNDKGFGYEDWHISCSFIEDGVHNILIPETVIFVRRKITNTEWERQKSSHSLLHAHPLLGFESFRNLKINSDGKIASSSVSAGSQKAKDALRKIVSLSPVAKSIAQKAYKTTWKYYEKLKGLGQDSTKKPSLKWLMDEWYSIHAIEKEIFPTSDIITPNMIYYTIAPEHYSIGITYKTLVDRTRYNSYAYIIFVPWLVKGGGDLYAINYANTIAKLRPNINVLVVATNTGMQSSWQNKLGDRVDFIPFGEIAGGLHVEHQHRVLEQLIENSGAKVLHVLNSVLGYEFLSAHQAYLSGSGKKVVITSFSQSINGTGRVFGFSHTHVPGVYDIADVITTDNQAICNMWQNEYGFNADKIFVHRQPIASTKQIVRSPRKTGTLKVLWAARLAPEKQPALLIEIGNLLEKHPGISIDMYGKTDENFNSSFLDNLPSNVSYKGAFDGFFSIDVKQYDVYLYTSLFDGMPSAILEAAQAGLPIIASAVGGIPEFIHDKETGILIHDILNPDPYAKALVELSKKPTLCKDLSSNATQKLSDEFSPKKYDNQVQEMLDILGS